MLLRNTKVLALVDAQVWNIGRARGCLVRAAPAEGWGLPGACGASERLGFGDGERPIAGVARCERKSQGTDNRSPYLLFLGALLQYSFYRRGGQTSTGALLNIRFVIK